ncbi:MAG: KpsF/GutQ family sugar-phosphate isomerase, partial [Caldimicrobium sp.]
MGSSVLQRALEILSIEKEGLEYLINNLDEAFVEAVELILKSSGRVIVTGLGKSGIIGRKISAT